jgi:hypothetical protein
MLYHHHHHHRKKKKSMYYKYCISCYEYTRTFHHGHRFDIDTGPGRESGESRRRR